MQTFQIKAASRLHFGMLAPAAGGERRFGGVGVMVSSPSLQLRLVPAEAFECSGPARERVRQFSETWGASHGRTSLPPCHLAVLQLPTMHSGLGVGTQLGLAVAWALNQFVSAPPVTPAQLAASVGRGRRSAVGTYGFFLGGLIAESGKESDEPVAPLEAHVLLPDAWRWLLVQPDSAGGGGLHGPSEREAFASLDGPDSTQVAALSHEMRQQLIPAARRGDFAEFSASLYRFGHQAGMCFAEIQGGAYNGPQAEQIVAAVRATGIVGVGQSSWGPTIFGLCPDEPTAERAAARLRTELPHSQISVTRTQNQGSATPR